MATADECREFTQAEGTLPIEAMGTFAVIDQPNPFNRAADAGEDDAWISSLLPMPSSSSSSPMKRSSIPLYADDDYKQAYQKISILSTEPLSNEEWTARRFQRERQARSHRQLYHERNQAVQQYYRSDQRGLEDRPQDVPNNVPNNSATNHDSQRHPRTRRHLAPISTLLHRERLIDRSRTAVSNTLRFLGSFSRNNRDGASWSEEAPPPTWVGRGGIEDIYRPNRGGLDSITGIRVRRTRTLNEAQALYGVDESDDDTAYWTTGTAMETVFESDDSSCFSETEDAESVLSTEEHQIDNEFLEWNYCTETQHFDEVPAFPHDPFLQFNSTIR
ncbi:MAG: hypothetical protein SGBAC_001706 [Bacillariaceae sp.]